MSFLKNLPYPGVIEELNFNELLKSIKELFKSYLTDKDIALLESDNYSALLETLAYRELLLRARINSAVKSMLLPFAQGSDLDNIVAIYGIERLKGEKPTARIELSLSTPRDADTIIPAGSGLTTPFPFVLKAKQLSEFGGGADVESDERLRERAVLSLERFSTAGSKKAYIYHALSANAKVEEANVLNGGPGIVKVYLKTSDMSEETRQSVADYLSGEKVRPLTDTVTVANATIKNIEVRAELELTDMFLQDSIDKEIKASKTSLSIGEDLNLSYVYSTLHRSGVYRARLITPSADTKVGDDSFIKVSFSLSYKKAEL